MRNLKRATQQRAGVLAWVLGAVATLGALHAIGCVFHTPVNCENDLVNCSGTGGPPPGCEPSMSSAPVADTCGVFVSTLGDDGNAGTKEKPLRTIGAALGKGTAIYACAGAMPFSEPVMVSKAVTLFGALDCATWGYDATNKTQLTAVADGVPLTLASTAGGSEVYDFAITAADAMTAGGSSIAVIDDGAGVVLEGVSVTAGAGAVGTAGMGQSQVVTPPGVTPMGATGANGTDDTACSMTGVFGGAGGKNTCGGINTEGGAGGDGLAAGSGGNGGDGSPMMTPGNGGSGQTASSCKPGGVGTDGSPGPLGIGARGIGDVSSTGYANPTGMLGGSGSPGQGGGGGGGALACDSPTDMFAGPSGGGGGAGGCPGGPGNTGQSGGSSIGILALGATLTLNTVSIATHDGGAGGTGGDGQHGGAGGSAGHAPMGSNACDGGKGGQGGAGGPGGGGAGGHSVAVAIKGGTLPDLSNTTIVPGMGGAGGPGGDMDMTAQTKGDDGMACKTLDFTNPMSPTACVM
jgi:hypothetical protein